MKGKTASFRVGKVSACRRGKVWYLCYYEGGQRRRPRVGEIEDDLANAPIPLENELEFLSLFKC